MESVIPMFKGKSLLMILVIGWLRQCCLCSFNMSRLCETLLDGVMAFVIDKIAIYRIIDSNVYETYCVFLKIFFHLIFSEA